MYSIEKRNPVTQGGKSIYNLGIAHTTPKRERSQKAFQIRYLKSCQNEGKKGNYHSLLCPLPR